MANTWETFQCVNRTHLPLPLIHSIFNVRQQRKGARTRAITSALFVTILIAALVQAEGEPAAQPAQPAQPADVIARSWTMNGSSCVPGDPAIQNNRYLVTAGTVKHQSTATGLITLYCPITFPTLVGGAFWSQLAVTYADSDGRGTVANITAQLVRLTRQDGSLTNIGPALDSNNQGPTDGSTMVEAISHTANGFDYYYVRVDLNRNETSAYSTLYGVSLR
jgi:hypothetical protein